MKPGWIAPISLALWLVRASESVSLIFGAAGVEKVWSGPSVTPLKLIATAR